MNRLEAVAVQLWEAARFLDNGTEAYLRLALDLADGACESLLHQECRKNVDGWRLRHFNEPPPLTRAKRDSIERDFNAKVAFLVELHRLEAVHGRALRRLHIYRNEAHHRNTLRPATLESAVRIFLYLASVMLETWDAGGTREMTLDQVPGLKPYYLAGELPAGFRNAWEHRSNVAQVIQKRSRMDSLSELTQVLSEHAAERCERIDEALHFLAEPVAEESGDEDRALAGVLTSVVRVARDNVASYTQGLSKPQRQRIGNLDAAFWGEILGGPRRIEDTDSPLAAFHVFADFEDAIEPLEVILTAMAVELDDYYSYLDDVARGK